MKKANNKLSRGSEQTQTILFKMIWMRSNKRSLISGLHLRDFMHADMWVSCFAHILPKAQNKYPHFKYYAGNIALLSPDEHHLWDHGTEEKRISYSLDLEQKTKGRSTANWELLKKREKELLELYKKHFPSTRNGIINYKYDIDEVTDIVGKLNNEFFKALDA